MLNQTYFGATVSDIHLFHHRTPTKKILEELREAFPDNEETAKLNTIYLAGDVFDKLVNYQNDDTFLTEVWIKDFLRMLKKNNTQLRVLEGTPSHDWKQSRRFEHVNKISGINADVKYFDDVEIEFNEKYGIHVLYIPDEHDNYTENTLAVAREKMQELGLEKVDLTIMHGQFNYQIPAASNAPKHDEEAYLALTRYFIFIGHVHVHSHMDRILAQGSFSRLSHGEERPKGHINFVLYPDENMKWDFIENKKATKYITVDVRGLEADEAIKKVRKYLVGLPEDSHVRVFANKGEPILLQDKYDELIRNNVIYNWSKPKVDDPTLLVDEDKEIKPSFEYHAITLTPDNLEKHLMDRFVKKGYDESVVKKAAHLLKGFI